MATPKRSSCVEKVFERVSNAVRIRPLLKSEHDDILHVENKQITIQLNLTKKQQFRFDDVFDCREKSVGECQKKVYEALGEPMIGAALNGYNAGLLAYGQTGSGKTFVMMGATINLHNENNFGIIPRLLKSLIDTIEKLPESKDVTVEVSYCELYNEKIYDLLSTKREPLKLRNHPEFGILVHNLKNVEVCSHEQILQVLREGNNRRSKRATNANLYSSRSHAIVSIELNIVDKYKSSKSKLKLVDLAGSERWSNGSEEQNREGICINQALLALRKVIFTLADRKQNTYIPYRDSLLTQLLRENLGGSSLTTMLGTVSPSSIHKDETLATLSYMHRARFVLNIPLSNEARNLGLVRELRAQISQLKMQLQERFNQSSLFEVEKLRLEVDDVKTKLKRTRHALAVTLNASGFTVPYTIGDPNPRPFLDKLTNQIKLNYETLEFSLRKAELWCFKRNFFFTWKKEEDGSLTVTDRIRNRTGSFDMELLNNLNKFDNDSGAFYNTIKWSDSEENQVQDKRALVRSQANVLLKSLRSFNNFVNNFQDDQWILTFAESIKENVGFNLPD